MTNDDKYFKPAINTDQTIYRQPTTDYGPEDGNDSGIEPSVFVTKEGRVGFNHYGKCVVKSIKEWVDMAWNTPQQPSEPLKELDRDELLGSIAQAWCNENNKNKEMDAALAMDICDIIFKKFGQPTEKKALSVERIEEILLTKHGQYLLTENAKQLAQAIFDALPAQREVRYPEKITYYHSKKEYPQNCVDAHNEAIDKFKKLNGG